MPVGEAVGGGGQGVGGGSGVVAAASPTQGCRQQKVGLQACITPQTPLPNEHVHNLGAVSVAVPHLPPRPHLPPTLKQELVVTLLEVLASHPSADLALQLPAGAPHDHTMPPPAAPALPGNGKAAGAGAFPGLPALSLTSQGGAAGVAGVPAAAAATPKSPPTTNKGGVTTLTEQQREALASLFGGGPATPKAGGSSTDPAAPSEAAGGGGGGGSTAAPAVANGNTAAPGVTALPPVLPAPVPLPPVLPPKVWTKDDLAAQPSVAELQARAVLWLGAAVTVLQRTRACLYWEPPVPPPMPGQPPSPALPPLQSVNLTTVPVDKWLQVLQCACHAARAVLRVHGHEELRSVYRANAGRMLQQLSPWDSNAYLSKSLESSAVQLQQVLQGELTRWRGLALAVRPRVLWVVAHYLELPGMMDDTWASLLAALEDVLLRLHRVRPLGRGGGGGGGTWHLACVAQAHAQQAGIWCTGTLPMHHPPCILPVRIQLVRSSCSPTTALCLTMAAGCCYCLPPPRPLPLFSAACSWRRTHTRASWPCQRATACCSRSSPSPSW